MCSNCFFFFEGVNCLNKNIFGRKNVRLISVFNASAICKDSPFNRRFESRKRKLLHDLQSESNVVYGWDRQIGTRRATNKFPSVRVQLVGQVVRYFPPFFVVVVVVVVCLFVCLFFFFF